MNPSPAEPIRRAWRLMAAGALVLAALALFGSVLLWVRVDDSVERDAATIQFVSERQALITCRLIDTKLKQIESVRILDELVAAVQSPNQPPPVSEALERGRIDLAEERRGLLEGVALLRGELREPCPGGAPSAGDGSMTP